MQNKEIGQKYVHDSHGSNAIVTCITLLEKAI